MEAIEEKTMSKYLTLQDCQKDRIDAFIQLLDQKIHEAKDMLIERFEYICSQDPSSQNLCGKMML